MPLDEGTKIGRYEIRSLLGVGGMGEVYLAFDTRLERNVAIKLLTRSDNKDQLARFRQEAKAIIALSHPHIITVYEFGQHEDLHYIVMEYLKGKTLRQVIKEDNLKLSDALEIGVQIANALSSAHASGIVHRDIKPENVMVLPDGYIKVLDFGLAKMTGVYKQLSANPDDSTASLLQTKAGLILGTVNYMSPEQLRGHAIDEQTDVWSLGVVLFEIVTRQRPFAGESIGDVIASVLEHSLPSVSDLNNKIPAEIEQIISKALQKDKTKRYQTVQDFAKDLKYAKIGVESGDLFLSAETLKQSELSRVADPTEILEPQKLESRKAFFTSPNVSTDLKTQRINKNNFGWMFAAVFLMTVIGAGFYLYLNSSPEITRKDWRSRRLSTNGNVVNAIISPDGRFIAYIQEDGGKQSLWLKQVTETAGTELIAPESKIYSKLTFAPDGNSIYYVVFEDKPFGTLYKIPILGGSTQKLIENVDSDISFSPDGKQFAFIRSNTKDRINGIIIAKADGSEQKVLAERKSPEFYIFNNRGGLSWSPDGKRIATSAGKQDVSVDQMSVIEIDPATGEEKPITAQKWSRVDKVVWSRKGDELYITAADSDADMYQIVRLLPESGQIQRITNELNDYLTISLSADDGSLLAVVNDDISSVFIAPADKPNQTSQIAKSNKDGINGLVFTPDGKIIYVSLESGNYDIWRMAADGSNRIQLSFDKSTDEYPTVSADGKYIVFVSNRTGTPHIWRMNADGSNPLQLTDKGGEEFPTISPNGAFVIYSSERVLWKVPIDGGDSIQLTKDQTHWSNISPDGKFIACLTLLEQKMIKPTLVSVEDGKIVKLFESYGIISTPKLPATIRWTNDSKNFAYISTVNGISNVWMQKVDEAEPKKITDFSTDLIYSFDFSKDGEKIIYARGNSRNDIVLFEDFTGK